MKLPVRLVILLLLFGLSSASQAVLIMTSVGKYEVTTITDTFNNQSAKLTAQVWWNNSDLAQEFAGVSFAAGITTAARFGYGIRVLNGDIERWACCNGFPNPFMGIDDPDYTVPWAVASRVPEPTTLALMTLGMAGIGYGRKRKAA